MPLYDYKCSQCEVVTESLQPSSSEVIRCPSCAKDGPLVNGKFGIGIAYRQLSAPAGITVNGRMVFSEKQMKKIKEPVWQYPDGSVESVC